MQKNLSSNSDLRLAELIAALSLASDLGMGQLMEYALCSCVLAVRLGETLGFSESELREDLIDGIEFGGAAMFLNFATGAHTTLLI